MDESTPSSVSPAEKTKRGEVALGITVAAGVLGALLVSGWFGEPVRASIALFIAALGGIVAGIVAGTSRDERAHAAGSAVLATIGITFAVSAYVGGRSSVYNLELLLPAAIGGLPGLLVYFGLRRLVPAPGTRAVAALGLAAAALTTAFAAAPSAPPPSPAAIEAQPEPGALLTSGERSTLDNQLGAESATFIGAVARIEAIVSIYGPGGIAKAGESGQRLRGDLERGLTSMRAEADRRIAAGEPAKTFAVLDAVERRSRAFLRQNGASPRP